MSHVYALPTCPGLFHWTYVDTRTQVRFTNCAYEGPGGFHPVPVDPSSSRDAATVDDPTQRCRRPGCAAGWPDWASARRAA